MKRLHEGLGILLKYIAQSNEKRSPGEREIVGFCQGEHDELFLDGPSPTLMSVEDRNRLEALGFTYDENNYDGWHCFT